MSGPFATGTVRVRVPATSANLGPGFDALGLALDLYDDVAARAAGTGYAIEVTGEGAADVPRDESHLLVRAMRATFALLDGDPPGVAVECVNRIPHARGLGSSAAAVVAGVLLARGLSRDGAARLPADAVLELAARIEGHPDNVAPCLLGGLTIAWTPAGPDGGARAVRRDVAAGVVPVAFVPPFAASTEVARGLLPATVPHTDAAFAAGRSALLVAGLTGDPGHLLDATDDRLHQSFREPAMPQSLALVRRLRGDGHAAVLSGAGPTVLVLAVGDDEAAAVEPCGPEGWTVRRCRVDSAGAHVVHER